MDDVRRARDALLADGVERVALVGRSFGGRMCARLAALEPPAALVVLGHPISPPNRPRPVDEAALLAEQCPTLIVQGEHDALGPLEVLQRIALKNAAIELYVLRGVGHQFGVRQAEGIGYAATWLRRVATAQ
jgi:predicted alpha/beta-hydrolase family hydrolase